MSDRLLSACIMLELMPDLTPMAFVILCIAIKGSL